MNWLLDRLLSWLQPILAVAAAVFLVSSLIQTWRLSAEKADHAETRLQWQIEKADAERLFSDMVQTYREREQQLITDKQAAEANYAKRIAALQAALVSVSADRDRLRDEIAAYSSGPADPSADSLAAARHRAETLGALLAAADARAERDAKELEALNEEKRLLLEAWPK